MGCLHATFTRIGRGLRVTLSPVCSAGVGAAAVLWSADAPLTDADGYYIMTPLPTK